MAKSQNDKRQDKTIAVYPGTFDPITLGHADIIARVSQTVDSLIVAVAADAKRPLFNAEERALMVDMEISRLNAEGRLRIPATVEIFKGLLVNYAKNRGARFIVRGIRAVSDFEYEFRMAAANRLIGNLETLFMVASPEHQFTSARLAKEILSHNGRISSFISPGVERKLAPRLKGSGKGGK